MNFFQFRRISARWFCVCLCFLLNIYFSPFVGRCARARDAFITNASISFRISSIVCCHFETSSFFHWLFYILILFCISSLHTVSTSGVVRFIGLSIYLIFIFKLWLSFRMNRNGLATRFIDYIHFVLVVVVNFIVVEVFIFCVFFCFSACFKYVRRCFWLVFIRITWTNCFFFFCCYVYVLFESLPCALILWELARPNGPAFINVLLSWLFHFV